MTDLTTLSLAVFGLVVAGIAALAIAAWGIVGGPRLIDAGTAPFSAEHRPKPYSISMIVSMVYRGTLNQARRW